MPGILAIVIDQRNGCYAVMQGSQELLAQGHHPRFTVARHQLLKGLMGGCIKGPRPPQGIAQRVAGVQRQPGNHAVRDRRIGRGGPARSQKSGQKMGMGSFGRRFPRFWNSLKDFDSGQPGREDPMGACTCHGASWPRVFA